MIKIITLSVCVALSGCAGAPIETTARYNANIEATAKKNTAASELEQKKVETLGKIEIARIEAQSKLDMEELRIKADGQASDGAGTGRPNIENCIKHKDDDTELYQWCLELEIDNYGERSTGVGEGHTISGSHNNIVIGSGAQEIQNGEQEKASPITTALISGMNKDPFVPIPKSPAEGNITAPLLKAGVSVAEKIVYGVLGYKAFDAIGNALSAGSSRESVRIDGDYVSRSNNPVTSTEYAPPGGQ